MVQKTNPHPAPRCNRSPPNYVFSKDAFLGSVPSIFSEVLDLVYDHMTLVTKKTNSVHIEWKVVIFVWPFFSLKSNHILSNRSKSINGQHFYGMYIQDCNYIWFVSWNVGIKIDCPIFDLSMLYYIARDLHNILTFHNQVTVRKTKIQKILFIVTER